MNYKFKKVNLLNFGASFDEEILEAIRNDLNAEEVYQELIKVSLNLSKNPYIQCHDIVLTQKEKLLSEIPYVINLPGLPIAGVFIVNEISALTGKEPTIVFVSRNISSEKYFSRFQFKRLFNLNYEKTMTRERFKNNE